MFRRIELALCASTLALAASGAANAADLRLAAYPEGVRFDLQDLRLIPAGRPDGPQESEDLLLPTPLRLRAVRDEVVAFSVLVTGDAGAYPLAFDLSGTSTSTPEVSLLQARGVRIEAPSESDFVYSLGPGLYPGPLVPTRTATVPEAGGALLWVDIFVPLGTPAGEYSGALTVGPSKVPVRLEVLPLDLPRADAARLGTVNFGSLLTRGHEDRAGERAWMQMAHAHGLSVEMLRPTPKVREDGSIDWASWAERVGPYIDGSAFSAAEGYRGPREGLPTTRWVVPLTDWWPDPATKAGLPSNPERWARTLKAWEDFVAAKGWFDLPEATTWIVFINSLDEPHDPQTIESLAAYAPLLEAAKLDDRRRVLFRVDGNFGQRIQGYDDARMAEVLGPVTDLWNVHGAPWTIPWARLVKLRREQRDRVMAYFSNTSGEPSLPPTVIDAPLVGLRAWGWIVYRYELEGLLNWEIDYWHESCPGNPRCSPGGKMNLEANLIFRAEAYGGPKGVPWASMRLKALRRGAQDAALLALLADKAPDTAGLIAAAAVPHALGDQVPGRGRGAWSFDPRTYARARDAVLDRLAGVEPPTPLATIRKDPLPRWAWHAERWLMALFIALGGAAALAYIIKKPPAPRE